MQQPEALPGQTEWTRTAYEVFMEEEGVPIFQAVAGVADVTELPRRPWARMGGLGTFIMMRGTMEGERGVYVAEIPGGGALNPEKHLYEEAILVLQGRGLTEVWQEGGPKVTFEWGQGSLFAPPINTWHRLINGSREPALFLAVTSAPQAMEPFHHSDFVFNCDYRFTDRFGGQADYFTPGKDRYQESEWITVWKTKFIPDLRDTFIDEQGDQKVSGGRATNYRMGTAFPNGYMGEWPVGKYHKAHYHGPGIVLIGLKAKGYALLWPRELGIHPYQDGHEDQVVTVDWKPWSIYSPPEGWFHQHMNTGREPARNVAVFRSLVERSTYYTGDDFRQLTSVREGGTMIDYEDEDPEIRRRFEEALAEEGVERTMPKVTYRRS